MTRILEQAPPRAARALLGWRLIRRLSARRILTARIVEVEAYCGERDPAAHAWHGRTPRTEPLWGPAGTWYVYLVYGMHHCLNVAVETQGRPGCVLIRAAEIEAAPAERGRGPGRLTRALDIDRRSSGQHAFRREAGLWLREGPPPARVGVSRRVGIRRAVTRPWRFFDRDSPAVSGPLLDRSSSGR